MYPMIYILFLPSLQIPRSSSDFSLPSRDLNFLSAFYGWNNLLCHLDPFGPFPCVGLLVGLDGYHLSILLLLDQIWCWRSCLLVFSYILPWSSPCIDKTRVLFYDTANKPQFHPRQACSLPQWCYPKKVRFVWLCLSYCLKPYQGESLLAFNNSFSIAISLEQVYTITFLTRLDCKDYS